MRWKCVYSSVSSTETGTKVPTFAPDDEDDKIGPDNFKNDEIRFPEPAEAIDAPPSSLSSACSSEKLSSSADGTGTAPPPLEPPLNPPKPPAELPLSAPNFDVIAASFGVITACNNC